MYENFAPLQFLITELRLSYFFSQETVQSVTLITLVVIS